MATERECASYELVKGSLHRAFTRVRGAVYDSAGVARYRVLLGSQMVCRAAADELAAEPGMTKAAADAVYKHFH